jgi:hypothetical protein
MDGLAIRMLKREDEKVVTDGGGEWNKLKDDCFGYYTRTYYKLRLGLGLG